MKHLPAGMFVLKIPTCIKPKTITEVSLSLAVATKRVIKNGLTVLGVSAPEKM